MAFAFLAESVSYENMPVGSYAPIRIRAFMGQFRQPKKKAVAGTPRRARFHNIRIRAYARAFFLRDANGDAVNCDGVALRDGLPCGNEMGTRYARTRWVDFVNVMGAFGTHGAPFGAILLSRAFPSF